MSAAGVRRVTAAVIVRDGKVLLTRRAPGQSHAGKWEFPGGKVEMGESDQQCLERELREELAITGQTGAFLAESLYEYERGAILLVAYYFDWQAGDMRLAVHDKILWILPQDIDLNSLTAADVRIAQALRGSLSF